MIIESAEKLELEMVEGAKKLVRVYIDESTDKKLAQELFVGEEKLTSEDRFR